MSESNSDVWATIGKMIAVSAASLVANYILWARMARQAPVVYREQKQKTLKARKKEKEKLFTEWKQAQGERLEEWTSMKLLDYQEEDGLMKELGMMCKAVFEVERVSNLVIDLQLTNIKTIPCPLVAKEIKISKNQPFLNPKLLISPGTFIIKQCTFRAGETIELQRKFMRAGPRSTQFFNPEDVRADIVCLGRVSPGINTLIRELYLFLKELYKVEEVFGVQNSFRGYDEDNVTSINKEKLAMAHHFGGCVLGVSKSEFHSAKIIQSLKRRKINQLYMIGGLHTLRSANELYEQCRKQQLKIALCVILKAVNNQLAIFDTVFGFESVIEQVQRTIQLGYTLSKARQNSIVMVKVPGRKCGNLAADACRAARNVDVCLVPQFQIDLYGNKGLLHYIYKKLIEKGSCLVVYAENAFASARDIPEEHKRKLKQENKQANVNHTVAGNDFDSFLHAEIQNEMNRRKLKHFNITFFNIVSSMGAIPANSLDTKLCCQIALSSIQGLMCGYTNFVCGQLSNKNAMVPIPEMLYAANQFRLTTDDEHWQRLLSTTKQPSFLNNEHQLAA